MRAPKSRFLDVVPARITGAEVRGPSLRAPAAMGALAVGAGAIGALAIGRRKSCDFAMNRTLRRVETPRKKWSMNEKWFGARITGPRAGTFSAAIPRARKKIQACSVVAMRTAS